LTTRHYMSGAQAVVSTLCAYRVDTIFGIPGVHTLPIYDALYHTPAIRHVLARHEQGAGFMAEGYARATGRPGVVCTITGPGATNVATPAASAYADSVPLLIISSTLSRATIGRKSGELHEIKDQFRMMEALVGWAREIQHVEEIPTALHDAFTAMERGRPRGAYIQIPYDVLAASAFVTIPEPTTISPLQPDQPALDQAIELLRQAERPLIIAGAGVNAAHANEALLQCAEYFAAPVLLSSKSHDVLPTDHPLVIATNDSLPTALDDFIASCDVALVVGSKLGAERTAQGRLPLPRKLIHIDIDPTEIGKNYPAQVALVADANVTLQTLLAQLQDVPRTVIERTAEIAALRTILHQHLLDFQSETFELLEGVRAALEKLPQDAIVVADMTMLGYAAAQYLPVYQPRTFIHPAEFCTIGCGFPLALGAQVGVPGRPVIALCGDGGFLLNAAELATAAQENIPVIAIIFNDATFTRVKKDQQQNYEERYIATDVLAPDYVMLAQAYHVPALRVETANALCEAIQQTMQAAQPAVIEVMVQSQQW